MPMANPLVDQEQLNRYFLKLEGHIGSAEKHLGLSHGTLGDLLVDSDYITILKISSTIEPLLNELLEKNVTRALSHPKVSFPGRGDFIKSVSAVRNHYAHNIKNLALSIAQIAAKAKTSDEGRSIINELCGFKLDHSFPPRDPVRIKGMLYYNFARFLSEALEGINPPPVQPALSPVRLRRLWGRRIVFRQPFRPQCRSQHDGGVRDRSDRRDHRPRHRRHSRQREAAGGACAETTRLKP
jgi:hypothetical protein